MLLLVCLSLATVGVTGQTPPPTPCPEVFQYWFQNGQWSGHVIVPVEEGVDEVAVVTSLFVADVIPPVPGGLHPSADINGVFRNVKAGWANSPSVEYKLIFPVQSPLPLLDTITVNNKTICQGIPARVRYATESTCRARLKGLVWSASNGAFGHCDSHHTAWKFLGPPDSAPATASAHHPNDDAVSVTTLSDSDRVVDYAVDLLPPTRQLGLNNVRTSCPDSQQHERLRKRVACGTPIAPVRTIYNGMHTARGDWPWLAALHQKTSMHLLCGGTLISARHVITAAHCFKDQTTQRPIVEGEVLVLLGKYDYSNWNEPDVQCREVERITIFPDYQERTIANDIAVLLLQTRVKFTVFVIPICLLRVNEDTTALQTGTVVGWGKEERSMATSERPLVAMVPIVSQQACTSSNEEFKNYVSERTMCAGDRNGTGPCNGDSGGGLVVPIRQANRTIKWYLRGIISFNLKGIEEICHLNQYSLYTDVSRYITWIEKTMKR